MRVVVADSTFYILFYSDIHDNKSLYHILDKYDMYVGKKLKDELKNHIGTDHVFQKLTNDIEHEVDFALLLKSFYTFLLKEYPEVNHKINDAEYEAMGLSYLLKQHENLCHLIIDDKYAYNFVNRNLAYIKTELKRTLGFLYYSYDKEAILERDFVAKIFDKIEKSIEEGGKPLYLTKEIWNEKIRPLKIKIDGRELY